MCGAMHNKILDSQLNHVKDLKYMALIFKKSGNEFEMCLYLWLESLKLQLLVKKSNRWAILMYQFRFLMGKIRNTYIYKRREDKEVLGWEKLMEDSRSSFCFVLTL